jgi:hypothetical protein
MGFTKTISQFSKVLESASFMPEFYTQSNDVALMTLLGTIQVKLYTVINPMKIYMLS